MCMFNCCAVLPQSPSKGWLLLRRRNGVRNSVKFILSYSLMASQRMRGYESREEE